MHLAGLGDDEQASKWGDRAGEMKRTTRTVDRRIIEGTRTGATVAANLTKVVLCALFLCCSACFHHKIAIGHGFRLEENGGAPMLVPTASNVSDEGNFQTTTLVLSSGLENAADRVDSQCMIDGEVFALRQASREDSRRWIVRSPSLSGWDKVASRIDIGSQWKIFTRGLARMNEDGCFPSGLSALDIRAAVAEGIPLPATEVPFFFYSDQGIGFTDLAPGMEIRLERFLPTAKSISAQGPPRLWIASYEVVPGRGKGVELKLSRKGRRVRDDGLGAEEKDLLSLPQRFAQTPVLRLFLEGVYGRGKVSQGILIGATNQRQLDALTDLIHQSDPAKCVDLQGTVCAEFPLGALSLFSTVWVNGRRSSCLLGSSLEDLLRSQRRPQQMSTMASIRVFRRVKSGAYVEIVFPHNQDGVMQIRLLPGDRVEWRQ